MSKEKFTHIALIVTSLTCAAATYLFFLTSCFGDCAYGVMSSIVRPVFFGSLIFSLILVVLLLFPSFVFKRWLMYIASWYVPLTAFAVASSPVTSAGLLMPSRSWVAIQAMVVLFVITVVYALIVRKRV